jgi:hypothetical protein
MTDHTESIGLSAPPRTTPMPVGPRPAEPVAVGGRHRHAGVHSLPRRRLHDRPARRGRLRLVRHARPHPPGPHELSHHHHPAEQPGESLRLRAAPPAQSRGGVRRMFFWWYVWGVAGAFLAALEILGEPVERLAPIATLLEE